jgi:hypothetical protein
VSKHQTLCDAAPVARKQGKGATLVAGEGHLGGFP